MSHSIVCYRCGSSLADLSLPFSQRDECPSCGVYLHVCRQCTYFDSRVVRQCREDGAEDVTDKEQLNFCDWYKPGEAAFDAANKAAEDAAKASLAALFGDDSVES